MTKEQKIAFYNHLNEFAINPAPIPESDEQKWSTAYDDRLLHFHSVPLINESEKTGGHLIHAEELTKEKKASELLAAILSEMLTSLHTIRGFSEILLSEKVALNETQRELVTPIHDRIKRLMELRETSMAEFREVAIDK